jgi:arylsulfatase A-like enzyme
MMKRFQITLLLFYSAVCSTMAADSARPNIVFLYADDQRPDTIGAHGNPHIDTPNLDRLAAEGFSFRQNYCAGSYSGAVCVASRSMLMTGRHWMRIADRKNWKDMPLLPEVLGKGGYQTFAVGKWHNGSKTLARAFQAGASLYMGGMADHTKVPLQDLNEQGTLVNPRVGKKFSSTLFADEAIDYLKGQEKGEQPFFLYVAFTAPHDPRNPPEAYRERYYKKRPPLPPNFLPQHPFDNGQVAGGRDESLADWPRDRAVISDQLCEYYGLITQLDEQVGRVMECVESSSFGENTIVIYTADHGLAMGSHGLLGKQSLYEHSMGCPLIMRGPGIPKGGSTDAMTYLLDLSQTICGLTGVEAPSGFDGQDLAPIWRGEKEAVRDSLFLGYQNKMRTVRDGQWKLHVYPQINHQLLFDLESDPHEMKDLAADPKYAVEVERLTKLMTSWQERLGDEQSLTVDRPRAKEIDLTGHKRSLDVWQPKWIREKYFEGRDDPDHGPGAKKK